jgi:hypothetical protein
MSPRNSSVITEGTVVFVRPSKKISGLCHEFPINDLIVTLKSGTIYSELLTVS